MTTIYPNNKNCTLINVFTVAPENQAALMACLKEATETVMSKLPGYISANLHLSIDQKTVTNYAQWASLADMQGAQHHPDAQGHMKKAAALALRFDPVVYGEIWTHQVAVTS